MGVGALLHLHRRRASSRRARRAAGRRARLAGGALGGAPGVLARENAMPQPAAHGVDRGRADDRPRARHARGHARRGRSELRLRGRRERALHRRLRGHRAEQLLADPAARRQRRRADARASTAVSSVRGGEARVFGKTIQVTARRPGPRRRSSSSTGSGLAGGPRRRSAPTARSPTTDYAKKHHLRVGSPVALHDAHRRAPATLRSRASSSRPTGGSPFGTVTISSATFDRNYQQPQNLFTFVDMRRRRQRRQHGRARTQR